MKPNVGTFDKLVRVIISLTLAVLFFTGYITGLTGIIAIAIAIILLLTTIVSFCPLYAIFGMSTCKSKT